MASSDYVAQFVFPGICSEIENTTPHASVDYQLWQKSWLTQLSERPLDLVSTIAEDIPENLYGKKMAVDVQVIVMRQNHPLTRCLFTFNHYLAEKHIIISGGGDKDSPVEEALVALEEEREVLATVPFFQSAMDLLMKSDAILTTPLALFHNTVVPR